MKGERHPTLTRSRTQAVAVRGQHVTTVPLSLAFSTGMAGNASVQGLFVPFARVGSGDPVRVLRLFHNEYTKYN